MDDLPVHPRRLYMLRAKQLRELATKVKHGEHDTLLAMARQYERLAEEATDEPRG
jgi:hypothetical protein